MLIRSAGVSRKVIIFLFSAIIFLGFTLSAHSASRTGVRVGGLRFNVQVKSIAELRWENLTRQGWDMSCGAAALSTLLTYHHGRDFSEMAVTLTILKNSDPAVVRERGGFSLYDLKRFVHAVGLEGVGYGEMNLDDLDLFDLPAIIPLRIGDLDHFVIFRKRIGGHVMLGDPAFGNISLSLRRFAELWRSRIAFYVVTSGEKEIMTKLEGARSRSPLSPDFKQMAIPDPDYGTRILQRVPTLPATRRATMVTPIR